VLLKKLKWLVFSRVEVRVMTANILIFNFLQINHKLNLKEKHFCKS